MPTDPHMAQTHPSVPQEHPWSEINLKHLAKRLFYPGHSLRFSPWILTQPGVSTGCPAVECL